MDSALTFTKMTATGNDFVIVALMDNYAVNEMARLFPGQARPAIAKKLCDRNFGIGADGLVILQPPTLKSPGPGAPHLKWDFYNSDGSRAEMCGNAARCVARYAYHHRLAPQQMEIQTSSGLVGAQVLHDESVCVRMPPIKGFQGGLKIRYSKRQIPFQFVNSGVPHSVIEIFSSQAEKKLADIAQAVKRMARFKPRGTNVTFFRKASKNKIYALTHERGVENFTLSCGTGAVAAAVAFRQLYPGSTDVKVQVPGGALEVSLVEPAPLLAGPAQFIADCQIYPGEI